MIGSDPVVRCVGYLPFLRPFFTQLKFSLKQILLRLFRFKM